MIRYEPALASRWDEFVRASKNGTFLFARAYQDYHRDRFPDASLIVTDDAGSWVAVLPATVRGTALVSHAGLTYGGFVVGEGMTTPLMLEVFERTVAAAREAGHSSMIYKSIPGIYHRLPAEEDRYALFRLGAQLHRRDVLSVVMPSRRGPTQERRKRGMKKAAKAGVDVRPSDDWAGFWSILEETLSRRHEARPVHSLEEMRSLAHAMPEHIQLMAAFVQDRMVAGTVLYRSATVDHAQYIAASPAGREIAALDLLFDRLIESSVAASRIFDFGISNEDDGRVLNAGLIEQKEGFGARAVVHDHYTLSLEGPTA